MSLSTLSVTQVALIIGLVAILVAVIAAFVMNGKRRTNRLKTQFGGAEYARAVEQGGSSRKAEASLEKRSERVERLHVQPLTPGDRERFIESWRAVQARFVDGPAGAVTAADQLLGDVMSTRGYPVSDFEQRAADISVDHPLVLHNYRTAHEIALRQGRGQASTEELRQAMVHYRTLFDDLVGDTEKAAGRASA